jgi:VWFA-related protein
MTRILATVMLALAWVPAIAGAQPLTRSVYVTAVDRNGAAVTDLSAADFAVKEGGKTREVASARPATGPLQIAILVDDNGTGLFRVAVARFIESLLGRAEFSIITVTGQPRKLTNFTPNSDVLREAIAQLNARPETPDGGQLLSGISEAAVDFERRKVDRPVILAVTVGGEEHTPLPPHHVLEQLRKSGAALHVVSVLGATLRATAPVGRSGELLNENLSLSQVLGDGPKRSGGRREEVPAVAGAATGLHQLAENLKNQYLVQYTLPEGVKPSDRLSVSVNRRGVTVRAPTHIPDK